MKNVALTAIGVVGGIALSALFFYALLFAGPTA